MTIIDKTGMVRKIDTSGRCHNSKTGFLALIKPIVIPSKAETIKLKSSLNNDNTIENPSGVVSMLKSDFTTVKKDGTSNGSFITKNNKYQTIMIVKIGDI